jgi:hypothetical protein
MPVNIFTKNIVVTPEKCNLVVHSMAGFRKGLKIE